jgi:cytochrome c2
MLSLIAGLAVLGVISTTLAVQDEDELGGKSLRGRYLFLYKGCIKCHAVWGVGKKLGPDLTRVGMGRSFLHIAGSFWNHSPEMSKLMEQQNTPRPVFTSTDIRDLITYLYSLNYFDEPGNPAEGLRVFSEKGCVNCHGVRGMGERSPGPRLDAHEHYSLPVYMSEAMWNHGPKIRADMAGQGPRSTFEGDEMADLLAFIRDRPVSGLPTEKLVFPGDPMAGQHLFVQKSCKKCHVPIGDAERGTGPSLQWQVHDRSVAEIAGAMWNHGPKVWAKIEHSDIPQSVFSKNEMLDLIAYLYSISYRDSAGNVSKGQHLFEEKGCIGCHAVRGGEEGIGPNLATSAAITSPLHLAAAMWDHATIMEKEVENRGSTWPKFQGNEMRDLIAYVRSFTPRSNR